MDVIFDNLFPVLFLGVIGYAAYRFFKDRSFSALIFGSKIAKTIGQIDLSDRPGVSKKVSIHILEDGRVALEEANSAILGFSVSGFSLSVEQARDLSDLLNTATE